MGVSPDLLPGYVAMGAAAKFTEEWGSLPSERGLSRQEMKQAAKEQRLSAVLALAPDGSDSDLGQELAAEGATLVQLALFAGQGGGAEVVLPVASAYEKSGTFTNTCGDLQLLKKAGDVAGVRSEFEIIVRIAERMGADIHKLVPFGGGVRADMGQTRGAQSGEADRHSVWLAANNLEPRLSPFDPMAILDEIQRLVPGYEFSRLNLLAGNDEHVTAAELSQAGPGGALIQIAPAHDTLFTSGSLGQRSNTLNSVLEKRSAYLVDGKEVMAD